MYSIKNKKQYKYHGFTLIELIVVITILAILGTIAFVSFSGYSISSRDSKRISDLSSINKALSVYGASNGSIPMPENYITISSGTTSTGTIFSYQGYLENNSLSLLKVSKDTKDPIDKEYYRYTVNKDKSIYQLIGYLEDSKNLSFVRHPELVSGSIANNTAGFGNKFRMTELLKITEQAEATDLSKRYIITRGYSLGTIINSTTKEALTKTNTGDIDLTTVSSSNNLKIVDYFSGSVVGTGTNQSITGSIVKELDLSSLSGSSIISTMSGSIATTIKAYGTSIGGGGLSIGGGGNLGGNITPPASTYNIISTGSTTRTWSDNTVATSCNTYRNPTGSYTYSGSTGDGTYRIDPDGAGGNSAFDVYCDMTTDGGGWTLIYSLNGGDTNNFSAIFNPSQDTGIWQNSNIIGNYSSWKTNDYKSEAASSVAASQLLIKNSTNNGINLNNVLYTANNCLEGKKFSDFIGLKSWDAIGSDIDWSTNGIAYTCDYTNFGFNDTVLNASIYSKIAFKWGEKDGAQDTNKDRTMITVGNNIISLSANVDCPRGIGAFTNRSTDGITYKDLSSCNGDAPSECTMVNEIYYLLVR